MKWKNEIPNKTEFMKINSFNFIECEKFHSELVHEENAGRIILPVGVGGGQRKEVKETRSNDQLAAVATQSEEENKERTMTETITLTQSATDFTGSAPKRYTTKCFIRPVTTPIWYSESLLLKIGSTKRRYDEKIYFKEKFAPFKWSESMETEVKTVPKCIYSEFSSPVDDFRDEVHVISLDALRKAQSTDL